MYNSRGGGVGGPPGPEGRPQSCELARAQSRDHNIFMDPKTNQLSGWISLCSDPLLIPTNRSAAKFTFGGPVYIFVFAHRRGSETRIRVHAVFFGKKNVKQKLKRVIVLAFFGA